MKQKILSLELNDGQSTVLERPDELKLVISYSSKRAAKDEHNRKKGIQRLRKKLGRGKLTKTHLNNKGYNKFLIMEGEVKITLDPQKIEQEQAWDGLKGYLTNCNLPPDDVIANYHHLWQIEKAFRISKTDLKVRPVYHYQKRRIESHICISFCAYKIYKELERRLKEGGSKMSPNKALEAMKTIYGIIMILPQSKSKHIKLLANKDEHLELRKLFDF